MIKTRGFTLLELILVVIILGILASLGTVQYTKVIEKSRGAEAKTILGQVRNAEEAYKLEYSDYSGNFTTLGIDGIPDSTCDTKHFFNYNITAGTGTFTATATRCTGANGKTPGVATAYNITLNQDGNLTVPPGY